MTRNLRNILVASVSVMGLAACGGGGNNGQQPPAPPPSVMTPPPPPPPPPAGTASVATRISPAFGAIFAADRNSEPKDPSPGDLTVNRTAEPIDF